MKARKVHDNQRVIGKAEGKEADTDDIHHKALVEVERNVLLRLRLKVLGVRKLFIRDP